MSSAPYTRTARLLHWLVAVFVAVLLGLGLAMTRVPWPLPTEFALYQWHKSLGVTVFALMLVRVAWRLWHPPPPLDGPIWRQRFARAAHLLFYAALLALPLTGWLMASAAPLGLPTEWFGLTSIPHAPWLSALPDAARTTWYERFVSLHRIVAWCLVGLSALHVAGAIAGGRRTLVRMRFPWS